MRANKRTTTIKIFDHPEPGRKQNLSKTFTPSMLNFKKTDKPCAASRNTLLDGLDWDVIFHGPETRNTKKTLNKATSVPKRTIVSPKDLNSLHMVFDSSRTSTKNLLNQFQDKGQKCTHETLKTTNASHDLSSEIQFECQSATLSAARTSLEQIRAEAKQCFENSRSLINVSRKKIKSSSISSDTRKGMNVVPTEIQKEILEELTTSIQILNNRLKSNEEASCLQDEENSMLKSEVTELQTKIARHKILMQNSPTAADCLIKCEVI
ncbi:hypothetical protein SteCoe_24003 [Stentor coeruleus]|uniref:Uncharacterized protein n=1 Tax=Stentor coeruleus TaxID=5963 RepID=A0A1R2BIP6_9CILI|nr:hypothetical protein SteCoe_24003 [Stentor coeruleus]